MARANAILSAVQRIHEAALDTDRSRPRRAWTAALEGMVRLVHGDHSLLVVRDKSNGKTGMAVSVGLDEADLTRFLGHDAVSLMMPVVQALPEGSAMVRSRLMSDARFERSALFNDVVRPAKGFYSITARLELPSLSSMLVVCRSRQASDFDRQTTARLQTILPLLGHSLELQHRLQHAEQASARLTDTLNRVDTGIIVVDQAARILFANHAAETLLAAGRGIGVEGHALSTSDYAAARSLRLLIADCAKTSTPGGPLSLSCGDHRPPLRIVVAAFPEETSGIGMLWPDSARPAAILLVNDPERGWAISKEALQKGFGLTAAEADVAIEIALGDGRQAAAERLGIAMTTVRSHLSNIFAKTGVRRQAELIRLLLQQQ